MRHATDWWILDLPHDPTPGDAWRIRELARRLTSVGEDAEYAARDVRALASDGAVMEWIGAAGDVFKDAIGEFPGQLDKVADSHRQAGTALTTFAGSLETAQAKADRALIDGREAHSQVVALGARLDQASASLAALDRQPEPPDEDQVRLAVRKRDAQASTVSSLRGQLGSAQAQLDAAKSLAAQAAGLREEAATTADRQIRHAADVGIPPDSFWDKLKDFAVKAWDVLIVIAKVVVAIGGIIALIIGGPIAWIVFAAALLVLADTLYKYSQGEATLTDVVLAAISCIPMTKGLTTLAALKGAWASGGALGAGAHLLGAGKGALVALKDGAVALWKGRQALPGLLRALPFTAWGKLTSMATEVRYGVTGSWLGIGLGSRTGTGLFATLRSGFSNAMDGWAAGVQASRALPSQAARGWQGSGAYLGIDLWHDLTIPAGTNLEALHPRLTGFVVPEGTMAGLANDSAAISRGVQVGPSDLGGFIAHEYRTQGVNLVTNVDIPAAGSNAIANSQFGGGGLPQYFVPDIVPQINRGAISVVDGAGNTLPVASSGVVTVGPGQYIPLTNFDLAPGSSILTNGVTGGAVDGAVTVIDGARRATQVGVDVTAPTR